MRHVLILMVFPAGAETPAVTIVLSLTPSWSNLSYGMNNPKSSSTKSSWSFLSSSVRLLRPKMLCNEMNSLPKEKSGSDRIRTCEADAIAFQVQPVNHSGTLPLRTKWPHFTVYKINFVTLLAFNIPLPVCSFTLQSLWYLHCNFQLLWTMALWRNFQEFRMTLKFWDFSLNLSTKSHAPH